MSTERAGLVLRGTLLKASSREVKPKNSDAFTVFEARVLSDARIHIVTFYDATEMTEALRPYKPGEAIELPVYGRARNDNVHLHYQRGEQVAATAAA